MGGEGIKAEELAERRRQAFCTHCNTCVWNCTKFVLPSTVPFILQLADVSKVTHTLKQGLSWPEIETAGSLAVFTEGWGFLNNRSVACE